MHNKRKFTLYHSGAVCVCEYSRIACFFVWSQCAECVRIGFRRREKQLTAASNTLAATTTNNEGFFVFLARLSREQSYFVLLCGTPTALPQTLCYKMSVPIRPFWMRPNCVCLCVLLVRAIRTTTLHHLDAKVGRWCCCRRCRHGKPAWHLCGTKRCRLHPMCAFYAGSLFNDSGVGVA